MKNNSRKTYNASQARKIMASSVITNIVLLVIVAVSAYKELSLSSVIAIIVVYVVVMAVASSYWMLINSAKGFSVIGECIE